MLDRKNERLIEIIRESVKRQHEKERKERLARTVFTSAKPYPGILGYPFLSSPILSKKRKTMHGIFITYHHENDQFCKEELLEINEQNHIFIDASVDTGEIDDSLPDEKIREIIRDEYLRNSTVTILLVGRETKYRKHIDWELYSSMYDGVRNKKSGIIVIYLPSTNCKGCTVSHEGEKVSVHPEVKNWVTFTSRKEYEDYYPEMPPRIIDNLLAKDAKISVIGWDKIKKSPDKLSFLIEAAHNDRASNKYDLSRAMKRNDS